MPSDLDASTNSPHRKLRTLQPEKHYLKGIAFVAQLLNPSGVMLRCERSLKSESLSLRREFMQSIQHYPSGLQCHAARIETGEAVGDWIGIHVFEDSQLIAQKKRRQRGFPRSVRAGNDDDLRSCFIHSTSKSRSIIRWERGRLVRITPRQSLSDYDANFFAGPFHAPRSVRTRTSALPANSRQSS